jgi:transcriptional regulator with XRE-family HTH domain
MVDTIRERGAGERTAARVRAVLAFRNLSLHRVSATSARIYGANSAFHIPHTLYHALTGSADFRPSLAQTCALSRITDYRIEDWLGVLGIDLGRAAGLEAALPMNRTRLLHPLHEPIGFPMGRPTMMKGTLPAQGVFPLGPLLRWSSDVHREVTERPSLFARIGSEDAFAWPELLPGSIVRVVSEPPQGTVVPDGGDPPLRFIEHERGFWCGRFHVSGSGTIHAAAAELAYAQTALRTPQEARIVGVVDMEIRWLHRFERPMVPRAFSRYQSPKPLDRSPTGLGALVRRARERAGLTLEKASRLSREIAKYLGRAQYAIAQSTLSEYEAQDAPPRHLEKVITLCLIYGIRLADLVAAAGTAPDELGRQSMPAHLVTGLSLEDEQQTRQTAALQEDSILSSPAEIGEMPWFLAGSFERMSGIPHLSLRDFYCLLGDQPFLPAHTGGSMLALVDRRKRKPARLPGSPPWQQPAWVLTLRSGEHRCGCCSHERENLVLYPESDRTRSPEVFLSGRDAEVAGQIVAVARRIPARSGVRDTHPLPAKVQGDAEGS